MYYTKRSWLVLCVALWLVFFVGSWWWNQRVQKETRFFSKVLTTSPRPVPHRIVESKQGPAPNNQGGGSAAYVKRTCSIVSFAGAPGPLTALATYSSSTWFRLLLEESTGIYTSSISFRPGKQNTLSSSSKVEFPGGSILNGSVVAIETSFPYGHSQLDNIKLEKAILFVSNPQKILSTEFLRENNNKNNITEWADLVQNRLDQWKNQSLSWLKFPGPLLIVSYKDMVKDLGKELDRILNFVDLSIAEEKFHCVLSNFNLTENNAVNDSIYEETTLDSINQIYNYVIQQIQLWKAEKLKADLALVDLLQ